MFITMDPAANSNWKVWLNVKRAMEFQNTKHIRENHVICLCLFIYFKRF